MPRPVAADIGSLVVVLAINGADAVWLDENTVTNLTPANWAAENDSVYVVQTEAVDPPEHATVHELPRMPARELEEMCAQNKVTAPPRSTTEVPGKGSGAFVLATQVRYADGGLSPDVTRVYEAITALSSPIISGLASLTPPFRRYQK